MNEDLLHEAAKKVLFLWVGPLRHHVFQIIQHPREHVLVDGLDIQLLPPGIQVVFFGLQLGDPGVQVVDLPGADLWLEGLGFEGREVAVDRGPGLGDFGLDVGDLLLQRRLLGTQANVGLRPDAGQEGLVLEYGFDVLQDRTFKQVGAHVVLVAVRFVHPAFVADVVRKLLVLLVGANANHVGFAPGALDDAGEQPFLPVVEPASVQVANPSLHDRLGFVEDGFGNESLVISVVDRIVPAEFSDIEWAFDDVQDDPLVPLLSAALAVASQVQLMANRVCAFMAE